LNNAVKFTPESGDVFLEMEGDPQADVVRFHIRDSGIGITEENLQTIFTPFQQVDSSLSRQYEGAGLGLALAAEMVKMHGGTLTVESIPRQGSHFCVSLPWTPKMNAVGFNHPAAQRSAHAPVQLPDPLTAPLILVAEDNPSNLEVLTDYLESKGYHLANALNGREAIQKTLELKPDLILMDIQMPEMDGLQAIRRIRQEASLGSIPIIALTALAMPGDRERCLEAGANGYLVKPVHFKELLGLMADLLQGSKEEKRD
jgi:CheY-like chemotaxis protein